MSDSPTQLDASVPRGVAASLREDIRRELEEFSARVAAYRSGALAPDDFKRCRLQLGIYGLRGVKDKQMVRVKVPSGGVTATQLERLADLAEQFATGRGHVTTRQDIQLYEVPIERTPALLAELELVGLTSREACGNSVRNVTACPFAGLCADELFDVAPYSHAVTRHFLRNPISQALPRKFKISFSGCAGDCALAPIHDIGAVAAAHRENGRTGYGFKLYVGGGLGALPKVAQILEPFTPVERLLPTCEAVIRVFDAHGNRKNKARARMKFLLEHLGLAAFQELVFAERDRLLASPGRFQTLLPPKVLGNQAEPIPVPARVAPPLRRWLETNARPQRQPGYAVVTVRLPLGDMSGAEMRGLAAMARRFGRGQLVTTQWQDICVPWVRHEDLGAMHEALTALGLGLPDAQRIQDVTSCPGADTCQIGITASRGLARALTELLDRPEYRTVDLEGIRIKISGCPNSCGQHHVAEIGLFGVARTAGGTLIPHYQLLVGGGLQEGAMQFGQPVIKLPARRVPQAIERLLQHYRRERLDREPFSAFVRRVGTAALESLLGDLARIRPEDDTAALARDWSRDHAFSLSGMGQGECAG